MNTTPNLNKAWNKARTEIANPKFDSENSHFRNKFASLKSVIEATIPIAAKHGIAVFQELVTTDGGIGCITHLCHESGEEKSFGPYVNKPTKLDPQGEASASTYARRYSLQAVFGVVGEAGDDGNAASASARPVVETITKKQVADLNALITEVSADREAFLKYCKVDSLENLSSKFYKTAVSALERKRAKP